MQAVSDADCAAGTERLFGLKILAKSKYSASAFAVCAAEYWATSLKEMTEEERKEQAQAPWQIEMYQPLNNNV